MGDLPSEKGKSGLIVMGDLPKLKNGLIVMGDLPRQKTWRIGRIVMGDLPRKMLVRTQRRTRNVVGLENTLPEKQWLKGAL
jgi:hypothetical protein